MPGLSDLSAASGQRGGFFAAGAAVAKGARTRAPTTATRDVTSRVPPPRERTSQRRCGHREILADSTAPRRAVTTTSLRVYPERDGAAPAQCERPWKRV